VLIKLDESTGLKRSQQNTSLLLPNQSAHPSLEREHISPDRIPAFDDLQQRASLGVSVGEIEEDVGRGFEALFCSERRREEKTRGEEEGREERRSVQGSRSGRNARDGRRRIGECYR